METKTKEVKLEWLRSRMFVGTDHLGTSIAIGYDQESDPASKAVNPSDLLLLAAASCSAYDMVQILEKGKQPLEDLKVEVQAKQNQEAPYPYVSLHFNYILKGDVDPEKIQRAMQLSEDKYCSVLATLKPGLDFTSEYTLED
ncbi:MAG TPA: OsmC family peroxiredoxin [Chloroflexi bacterium]|nr:OsmC family peroxiredoxin [Chloroflexota bacterium]